VLTIEGSKIEHNEVDSDLGNCGGGVSSMLGALKVTNSKLNNNEVRSTTVLAMGAASTVSAVTIA
jgi:hypothetical protein